MVRSRSLDPEVLAWLEMMEAQGAPPIQSLTAIEARAARNGPMKAMAGEPDELAHVEDLKVPGLSGDIPVRIYASEKGGLRPALVFFHGGGFVVGNVDTHDAVCRAIARESGAVVISVDYGLAPERKFPVAVDDAHAATVWVADNAEHLGVDLHRISVGGDSAGGNLATVVAIRCRDAGGPALASQVLIYPVADLSSFETESYRTFKEGYGLTRVAMMWFGSHYLSSPEVGSHPEASPLLAPDLRGLPPALVITAEFDPLRDEGEAYARRLEQAGVPVTLTRYPGMIHGFVLMRAVLAASGQGIRQTAEFIRSR